MVNFKVENVSISIHNIPIFQNKVSFEVKSGEVIAITGASGCGKSSLLSYFAGSIEEPLVGSGILRLDDIEIQNLSIEKRQVGLLYQDDLLFPHLTVEENLLYAMSFQGSKIERLDLVKSSLESAHLDGFLKRYPLSLSGGQRARVSLLRTLLAEPKLILLDEPFSKLDLTLRQDFRTFVYNHIRQKRIPCVLVTHDLNDVPPNTQIMELK